MWKKEGGYETESAKNLGVDRTLFKLCSGFCIEIALNALIGDRVPVGVWLAAALYPVCFYLFRKS